jgi:Skp family chaperone for outer membrane proteins
MMRHVLILLGAGLIATALSCTQHKVEVAPVEIKPIHITIDVNVKVDRALDNFFGDIDAAEKKLEKKPTSSE